MTEKLSEDEIRELAATANALFVALGKVIEESNANCGVLSVALGKLLAASTTFFASDERSATALLDEISELAETYIGQFHAIQPTGQPVQ
jgi:hypothetical protein